MWLFSFDLAAMVSLRIWISVRRVFAAGVGFVYLCPGGSVDFVLALFIFKAPNYVLTRTLTERVV